MMKISVPGRGRARSLSRCLGLAAAALFALSVAPGQRAEALSLINPGALPAAKHAPQGLTIEVAHGGHGGGGGWHGGGGGGGGAAIHGGSFKSGGPAFSGSGVRSFSRSGSPVFHGSGIRHSGFAFRHHRFHRRFFVGASYYPYDDYPYYYSYRRCRTVWTDYGPRRVCHYRHWRHHHWRHHHRRHHHYRVY
jgi:hypothetical protein